MPDNNKTEEFLQKLTPCIEHGDLDACVEEAARLVKEMRMDNTNSAPLVSFDVFNFYAQKLILCESEKLIEI